MTFEEGMVETKKHSYWYHHLFTDTVNTILMDLYINFQDSLDEDIEQRKAMRDAMAEIVNSYWTCSSTDGIEWTVRPNPEIVIYPEVLQVLGFILDLDTPAIKTIPEIFKEKIRNSGMELSTAQFYRFLR